MKKKITTTLMLLLSVLSAGAQTVSIEQCQQWAEANYPLIHRYELLRQTETFTLAGIQRGWLPQIGVTAQATLQSAVPEYPTVLSDMLKQMGQDLKGISPMQYRAAVDVQQTLYDGAAIASQRRMTEAADAVQSAAIDVQIYALRERVDNLCFCILLLDQYLLLNAEKQNTLTANLTKLRILHEGGVAMQSDVDALEAELLTARQQHTDLEAQRETFLTVLRLFTGQELEAVARPTVTLKDAGERPELHLFNRQLALVDARQRMLDTALLPRVGLFAQGYYGYLGMNMFRDMMKRTPTLNGIIGIKASWNISALYTRKNDLRKLATERQTIANDRDTFLFNQRLQSQQEDSHVVRLRRLISEDDSICRLRRSVCEAAEAKLEAGTIDVSVLVQEISRENQAALSRSVHEIELLQHQFKSYYIKGE